jgi:hypothetical protein
MSLALSRAPTDAGDPRHQSTAVRLLRSPAWRVTLTFHEHEVATVVLVRVGRARVQHRPTSAAKTPVQRVAGIGFGIFVDFGIPFGELRNTVPFQRPAGLVRSAVALARPSPLTCRELHFDATLYDWFVFNF